MKQYKMRARVEAVEWLNCSRYGNPRARLTINAGEDFTTTATTATNSAAGWFVSRSMEGRRYLLTYHITRNGSMIIDSITQEATT